MLVRDVQYHQIDTKQLQVLLGYAEQDIHDYTRQATALTLLKVKSKKLMFVTENRTLKNKLF